MKGNKMDNRTAAAPLFQPASEPEATPYTPRPDKTVPDMTRLARQGRMISEAIKSANAAPDVREDKIAALRAKIASGTYQIDTARIARALIREEPGLFQI